MARKKSNKRRVYKSQRAISIGYEPPREKLPKDWYALKADESTFRRIEGGKKWIVMLK